MMHRFGEHGWGMGFGMGWWWIIGLIIVVIIVWLGVKAINQSNQANTRPRHKSSLDILKDRYAKGEMTRRNLKNARKI